MGNIAARKNRELKMSDPDQEEIRRKRLARLGASPTSSSSQGASQQGAHMSDTADGARSTRETPTKSRSNSGEARDPAFHQAVKSDMTSPTVSEDISMQTIEEAKESDITKSCEPPGAENQSNSCIQATTSASVPRSDSSTAMDVTFTPS